MGGPKHKTLLALDRLLLRNTNVSIKKVKVFQVEPSNISRDSTMLIFNSFQLFSHTHLLTLLGHYISLATYLKSEE